MADSGQAVDFLVKRGDLNEISIADAPAAEDIALKSGQILVRVGRFALTANNITYAVVGDLMAYWSFFPAPDGWGRIPVWGFGEVAASRHGDVAVGERLYGFWPMSTHLVLQPERVSPAGFLDGMEHRRPLHAIYNHYTRVDRDPGHVARYAHLEPLLRPLFTTGFLLDDFLVDNDLFGARAVLLASASSKTAIGLAFCLARRQPRGYRVIGLTSAGNAAFVDTLGCYDQVVAYDDIASLSADMPVALVDMAGNAAVQGALPTHFGANMKYSCRVGRSHWDSDDTAGPPPGELPGAKPVLFFAPDHAAKRQRDWGPDGFQSRLGDAWRAFLEAADGWLTVIEGHGPEAVEAAYRQVLAGRATPNQGHLVSL